MPYIEVKAISGVFSDEQKREVLKRMTDVLVDLEGEYMRPVTVATFNEVESGSWAFGGNAITREDVGALKAGA